MVVWDHCARFLRVDTPSGDVHHLEWYNPSHLDKTKRNASIVAIHDLREVSYSLFCFIGSLLESSSDFLFGTLCSRLGTVPCIVQPRLVHWIEVPFTHNVWIPAGFAVELTGAIQ